MLQQKNGFALCDWKMKKELKDEGLPDRMESPEMSAVKRSEMKAWNDSRNYDEYWFYWR